MDSDYVLSVTGINKSFGSVDVLKNVDFALKKGEIHGLMGENGAGKSTLIKIISGDYTRDSGEILLDGKAIVVTEPREAIDLGIRVIYQEFNIVRSLTVAENIFIGNVPRKHGALVDWKRMNSEAKKVLDSLGETISPTARVGDLSVAEQQIVEIAKALSVRPKILVMDEPTAALNDQETQQLFKLLRALRDSGVSIVYITHRFSEIYELCDRITVMRDGQTVGVMDIGDVTDEKLVQMMAGRKIENMFERRRLPRGEPVFELRDFSLKGKLDRISLTVNRGEIVVVFGLFGHGQNELCRAIFGDIPHDSGEMILNGQKLDIRTIRDACDSGIGFVTENRKTDGLIPMRSVKENITLAALMRKLCNKFKVILFGKENELAYTYFTKLNVRCSGMQQKIGSLSGGNQQKAIICRWLANDTKLLLLNMPTRGVDVGARAEIYRALENLCEQGVAIIVVSLEMPEVLGIADRIYVMHERKIVGEMDQAEATQEQLMRYAVGIV